MCFSRLVVRGIRIFKTRCVWSRVLIADLSTISHLNAKLIISTLSTEQRAFRDPQFACILVTFMFTSKAVSRLGARARTLCPGTKRNVVQTPWCPKFRFNLLWCCHLVIAATSNHSETWVKSMALMESCADKCPCPGMVPEYYLWRECPHPGTMLKFLYGHH